MTAAAWFPIKSNGYPPEDVDKFIDEQAAIHTGISNENRQLKDALQRHEQKLREIVAAYEQLKKQSDIDRIRLAELMMQANKTAGDVIEKARNDAKILMEDANRDAQRIKGAAAADAANLRKKMDEKFCGISDVFDKVIAATEVSRQNLLNMFSQADKDARQASLLLHTWKQTNAAEVIRATEQAKAAPPEKGREWLETVSDLLKNVPTPTKTWEDNN